MPILSARVFTVRLLVATATLLPFAVARPVAARPLTVEACHVIEQEALALEQAGVRSDMEKGAAWGKAQLPAARLQSIRRLIELDEQLVFRCTGRRQLVLLKEDLPEEPRPEEPDQTNGAAVKPAVPPEAKAPPRKTQRTTAAAVNGSASGEAAVPAKGVKEPVAAPKRPPPRPAATKPAAAAATAEAATEGATEKAPPAPRPRPKPKTNDAFTPKAPAEVPTSQ